MNGGLNPMLFSGFIYCLNEVMSNEGRLLDLCRCVALHSQCILPRCAARCQSITWFQFSGSSVNTQSVSIFKPFKLAGSDDINTLLQHGIELLV